jgi:hypothetical protein
VGQSGLTEAGVEIVDGVMLGGQDFVRPPDPSAICSVGSFGHDLLEAAEHQLPMDVRHSGLQGESGASAKDA